MFPDPYPYYQDIQLFDGRDLEGGILKNQLVLARDPEPDIEFWERHYFNVSQYSITSSCFEYWSKLKTVANPTGSFIDVPPAAVLGNIYNVDDPDEPVLGYFEVAGEEVIRTFSLPPLLVPHYYTWPCINFDRFCYDCLQLPESTYDRPEYW
jgi:hypothetical protein